VIVIAVVNLKGGSTKTTTAAFMLHALHESGLRVLGVDADGENESLLSWQELGTWEFPVVGLPVPNLHRQLPGITGEDRYDAVVIDTPPMKERYGIVVSAARVSTHVVCPMAPTSMEYDRLPAVQQVVQEATDYRDGNRPAFAVLLTRTVATAASTQTYRELIEADGVTVLGPTITRKERYAQAYGGPIKRALTSPYGDATTEVLSLEGVSA